MKDFVKFPVIKLHKKFITGSSFIFQSEDDCFPSMSCLLLSFTIQEKKVGCYVISFTKDRVFGFAHVLWILPQHSTYDLEPYREHVLP